MLRSAVAIARATRVASRRAGKGGTTAAGRVLLRLEPDAIAKLSQRLDRGSVLVSATPLDPTGLGRPAPRPLAVGVSA